MLLRPANSSKAVKVLTTLTLLALGFSVTFLLWSLRARELRHARLETVSITQMLMEQTEQNFESTDLVLQGIQERLTTTFGSQLSLDSTPVHLLLNARVSGQRHLRALFVVDAKGRMVNSSLEEIVAPQSMVDREYFKAFAKGQSNAMFIGKPVRGRLDGKWTLHVSRPLISREGVFRGVVVASMLIQDLEQTFNVAQLDYSRPIALYQEDGTLLASQPYRDGMLGEPATELLGESLPVRPNQIRTVQHTGGDGERETVSVGRLAGYPLWVGVALQEENALAVWRETAIPIAAGALTLAIFTVFVAFYLVGKLHRKDLLAQELNSAYDRYQHTVDSVMDAIVAVDESMTILLFNPAAERMFGRSAQEILGEHLNVLIPDRFRGTHVKHMEHFTHASGNYQQTMVPQRSIVGLRSDGTEFPVESTFSKSVVAGQVQLTAVLRDVTQKRQTETQLRELNAQLRELSSSLQHVREQERARISRELHDDLGQQLTGLKLSLSWLGNRIKEGRETAAKNVDDMRHQLDTAIASVRRIAAELRPRVLDDRDFAEALTWQTQEFARHSHLAVHLSLPAAGRIGDDETATALFRIVQEALTNVVRHAEAKSVYIDLAQEDDRVVLSVRDDGRGFDHSARQGGIGLVSMRERCTALGLDFGIVSHAGEGTTILVTIPAAALKIEEARA
jgi:PAS domain S-box-containing protein